MYLDYYETDQEEDPDYEVIEDMSDEAAIAAEQAFEFKRFDFLESSVGHSTHETFDDILEQKIFKFKYRQYNDN